MLLFVVTIFFMASSFAMFYLQNFYVPQQESKALCKVYIAKEEINPLTTVTADLFKAINLPADAISEDYVLDISEVMNYKLKSTIYKREILAKSHITSTKPDPSQNLLTVVVPKYYDDIKTNDLVNIYVIKGDKKTNVFTIEVILEGKKVEKIAPGGAGAAPVAGTDGAISLTSAAKKFGFSIILSEAELKKYYAGNYGGEILATKVVNPNLTEIVSGLTDFDPSEIIFKDPEIITEDVATVEETGN